MVLYPPVYNTMFIPYLSKYTPCSGLMAYTTILFMNAIFTHILVKIVPLNYAGKKS